MSKYKFGLILLAIIIIVGGYCINSSRQGWMIYYRIGTDTSGSVDVYTSGKGIFILCPRDDKYYYAAVDQLPLEMNKPVETTADYLRFDEYQWSGYSLRELGFDTQIIKYKGREVVSQIIVDNKLKTIKFIVPEEYKIRPTKRQD